MFCDCAQYIMAIVSTALHNMGFGLGLGSLMPRCLSKDFRCHVWPYFSKFAIMKSNIRPHMKWTVILEITWLWSLESSSGVCVGIYGSFNILTLWTPRVALHYIRCAPERSTKATLVMLGYWYVCLLVSVTCNWDNKTVLQLYFI